MDHLNYPVMYLEVTDFDKDGNLINPQLMNTPLFVFIMSSGCGYCTMAKPEFQKLANSGVVDCAVIQVDGERDTEKMLAPVVSKIYPGNLRGFPSYFIIDQNGTKRPYDGGRDAASMSAFVSN